MSKSAVSTIRPSLWRKRSRSARLIVIATWPHQTSASILLLCNLLTYKANFYAMVRSRIGKIMCGGVDWLEYTLFCTDATAEGADLPRMPHLPPGRCRTIADRFMISVVFRPAYFLTYVNYLVFPFIGRWMTNAHRLWITTDLPQKFFISPSIYSWNCPVWC